MYTLDQQIKDVDKALEVAKEYKKNYRDIYLCNVSQNISSDFYYFLIRAFKRMDKISPKAYKLTIFNPLNFSIKSNLPLWDETDYESRLQFLNDLKEDIIENG